jgi:di/tricarboxylate transporter
MPVVAGQLVLSAMPQEIPLEASQVQALLWWMIEPIRPVGIGLVVAGVGAVVSSVAVDAMRRRSLRAGEAAETIQSPLQPGA